MLNTFMYFSLFQIRWRHVCDKCVWIEMFDTAYTGTVSLYLSLACLCSLSLSLAHLLSLSLFVICYYFEFVFFVDSDVSYVFYSWILQIFHTFCVVFIINTVILYGVSWGLCSLVKFQIIPMRDHISSDLELDLTSLHLRSQDILRQNCVTGLSKDVGCVSVKGLLFSCWSVRYFSCIHVMNLSQFWPTQCTFLSSASILIDWWDYREHILKEEKRFIE